MDSPSKQFHIKKGANNLSSDADITGVNIVGNGTTDSIGVLIEGFDNTLTNMRIANVFICIDPIIVPMIHMKLS